MYESVFLNYREKKNVKTNTTLGCNQKFVMGNLSNLVCFLDWYLFFGAEMEASSFRPLGYPLSYYMTCQGSLGIFVILIFWFANKQEKIDEEFGFSEREDD